MDSLPCGPGIPTGLLSRSMVPLPGSHEPRPIHYSCWLHELRDELLKIAAACLEHQV